MQKRLEATFGFGASGLGFRGQGSSLVASMERRNRSLPMPVAVKELKLSYHNMGM